MLSSKNTVRVSFDGSCEPVNPGGTAKYGYVIEAPGLDEDIQRSGVVGSGPGMTNNVAEYAGFSAAVGHLLDHIDLVGRTVWIRSDSQLVINQLKGNWKINVGPHKPYYDEAVALLRELRGKAKVVSLEWIPRRKNQKADVLSKTA